MTALDDKPPPPAPPGVLDSEGWAICPECDTRVNCAKVGLRNLTVRHIGSKKCIETKAKRSKDVKIKKDGSLFSFFSKPKPAPVPSTVSKPALLVNLTVASPPLSVLDDFTVPTVILTHSDDMAPASPVGSDFFERLLNAVASLPESVPVATEYDRLAEFGGNPAKHDDRDVASKDLWEVKLNGIMKSVMGWGIDDNVDSLIRRGRLGLDGLVEFIRYFVVKCGVDITLFEGKLSHLLRKIEEKIRVEVPVDTMPVSNPSLEATVIDADASCMEEAPIACNITDIKKSNIVAKSSVELKERFKLCSGYKLTFPNGKSPHSMYPFGLHNKMTLPWSYQVTARNDLILRASDCTEIVRTNQGPCRGCQNLQNNDALKDIIQRAHSGVHVNTPFAFLGIQDLIDLLRHKNQQIEDQRHKALNLAWKLVTAGKSLDHSTRLIHAIASGQVNRVDRLLSVCLERGMGFKAVREAYFDAANGVYHPRGITEKEALKAILMWKMSGNRFAEINHRANGAPSITYLRSHSTVPSLIPSPQQPTADEVKMNLAASISGILDVLSSCVQIGGVLHTVLMLDEIATEKGIHWDPKSNNMIGVCREHSHKASVNFVNEGDMTELFACLDSGEIHYAGEATIAAIGPLCGNNKIYPARAVMVSGDCKKESGKEHAVVLQTVVNGINMLREQTNFRIVSIASDGEARRGAALIQLTFKKILDESSPIFDQLKHLIFLNRYVGDDNLTCDKDYKHIFKRLRNLLIRARGISVNGHRITPDTIIGQLKHEGHKDDHIRAIFNPEDKQDVKLAYDMLRDIWSMPRTVSEPGPTSGFLKNREALWILGKLAYHLVFSYICVDLTLSEQIEHLSAAAPNLALALYKIGGKEFIPTNLYVDIQLMIKNIIFCVAKAKADNPGGEFWINLLGTDRLEQLFGILRTMVGNDSNLDILQLVSRLAGTTEVANILAMYPQWDRSPRRLKLPILTKQSAEIPERADHIKPGAWRGNVKLSNVSLQTSWRRGRKLAEEECDFIKPILSELEDNGVDVLSPFGVLLVTPHTNDTEDDVSMDSCASTCDDTATSNSALDSDSRVAIKNHITDQLEQDFPSHITIDGKDVSKARILAQYSKNRTQTSSTDRLRRVRAEGRYVTSKDSPEKVVPLPSKDEAALFVADPIGTLLYVEGNFWLCIAEVNALRVNGVSVECVSLDMLLEKSVTVSYQILGLRRATSDDDPQLIHDWRTYSMSEMCFTVPGQLVQPVNPELSKTHTTIPFYLFRGSELVAIAASIFQSFTSSDLKKVEKVEPSREYPYRELNGYACFVCETDCDIGDIGSANTRECPCCKPSVILDLTQPQRVLEHMGEHILFDPAVISAKDVLCGLCLLPTSQCRYFLGKGRGARGKIRINEEASSGCFMNMKFSYNVAVNSKKGSPCSNAPLQCPVCEDKNKKLQTEPAVWRYFMRQHFEDQHKTQIAKHSNIWTLTDLEVDEMKKIWVKRSVGTARPVKNANVKTLKISEGHRAQITMNPEIAIELLQGIDGTIGEDIVDEGDEYDATDDGEVDDVLDNSQDVDMTEDHGIQAQIAYVLEQCALNTDTIHPVNAIEPPVVETAGDGNGILNGSCDEGVIIAHEGAHERATEANPVDSIHPEIDVNALTDGIEINTGSPQMPQSGTSTNQNDVAQDDTSPVTRRRKTARGVLDMQLNDCLCGLVVEGSATDAVKCSSKGCETQYFHRECIESSGEVVSNGWTCSACVGGQGKQGKGSKRARKARG